MKVTALIFDLDGTLTRPYLDFGLIRAEIGNVTGPLLEAMDRMKPDQKQKALDILHRHEKAAAENSQLNPGVHEICAWLRERKLAIGLVTRNQRRSVEHICQVHNLSFDGIVTREDGPVKPDPFPVLQVCRLMNVQPSQSVVVGDYLFDLVSARDAGACSVLLSTNENYADFAHEADYVIASLNELPAIIDNMND